MGCGRVPPGLRRGAPAQAGDAPGLASRLDRTKRIRQGRGRRASGAEVNVPDAVQAIAGVLPRTPVLRSETLDALAGARLWFKAEGLQVTGSFKVRGAWNRVRSFTPEELAPGLITVSAGNAALGAAWAARRASARLVVVMPENAVPEKLAAVASMGARIEKDGVTNATQAFERLARLRSE